MQLGRKTNMNRHQKRPFAARSQQRPSNALRPEPQGSHNARRNYDRYVALAQAELQAGDRVAAENYYQHSRTLFQNVLKSRSDIAAGERRQRPALEVVLFGWRKGARPRPRGLERARRRGDRV